MQLLLSPWAVTFDSFAHSITRSAWLVSPFISEEPLQRLSSILDKDRPPRIEILTNLAVDNLIQGSTDVAAIAVFCRTIRSAKVWHLPGLHAKVYVADDIRAIVTSANLTRAGLSRNYEYGIEITERSIVSRISEDLKAYGELGSEVPLLDLDRIAEISHRLNEQQRRVLRSARQTARQEFEKGIEAAREALMYLRAKPGESTNTIFSRTLLYVLRNGPLSTPQLHPLIQEIHPDLCDDSIDRVIGGVNFGKRWKHMVRNAQQALKNRGLIEFKDGKWHLA